MITEAQKRAKKKYAQKVKRLTVSFYPTEKELTEHLEKQPQKQTYIKDLIRKDIATIKEVKCKDCKHLMFSDCYGECSKAYKGIVRPNDSCGHGARKE